MERMNRALRWLAVVGLVAGLANALLQTMIRIQQAQPVGYGSSGPTGSLSAWMVFIAVPALNSLVYLLVGGVAVLGMVAAWMNQRRSWLNVLLVVTLASILWPYAYEYWNIVHPSLTPPTTGDATGLSFSAELYIFSVFASPLAPVIFTLVFSAFSHADARAAEDTRFTSDADAALEITRSPL